MKNKTKSLLESLVELAPVKDTHLVIESRGINIIASAIALLESIQEHYGEETAADLERRLLSSIKNRNNGKYVRATRAIVVNSKKS